VNKFVGLLRMVMSVDIWLSSRWPQA